MSEDLNHLVKKYSIKHERTLKRICAPLHDLNITEFGYVLVKSDGSFCNINTLPAFLEYFYANEMGNSQPYFSHPDLFQSGYTLTQACIEPIFQKKCEAKFNIGSFLCKLLKHQNYMELFLFHPPITQSKKCLKYLNHIYLLDKFATYFKQEAKAIITKAMEEGYNILKNRGPAFYEASSNIKLLNNDFKTQQFLKKISPLTIREHQCLELFKKGRSAQATAAILDLSQRTVEHYFENIKVKLKCQSKMELLER